MPNAPIALLTVALAAIAAGLSLFVPPPATTAASAFHSYFATVVAGTVLFFGAAISFLRGLGGFHARLKAAYITMCIGFILFGLTSIQFPLLSVLGLTDTIFNALFGLPVLFAALFVYVGVRNFARLFSVRNFATNIPAVVVGAIAVSVLITLLPHPPSHLSETTFKGMLGLSTFDACFAATAAFLTATIRRNASPLYAAPSAWLFVGLLTLCLPSVFYALIVLAAPQAYGLYDTGIILLPNVLGGLFLLQSAAEFRRITAAEPTPAGAAARQTPVDVIIYLAYFASDPRSIDGPLDQLRTITARAGATGPLSAADQKVLSGVYTELEEYLVEREPVRKFTRADLRQRVAQKFQELSHSHPQFWRTIASLDKPPSQHHT